MSKTTNTVAFAIILFTVVIDFVPWRARVLITLIDFYPRLIFECKCGAYFHRTSL
jgi:hypothetical protein